MVQDNVQDHGDLMTRLKPKMWACWHLSTIECVLSTCSFSHHLTAACWNLIYRIINPIGPITNVKRLVQDFGFGAFCDSSWGLANSSESTFLSIVSVVMSKWVNYNEENSAYSTTLHYKTIGFRISVSPSTSSNQLCCDCCAHPRQRRNSYSEQNRTGVIAYKINNDN